MNKNRSNIVMQSEAAERIGKMLIERDDLDDDEVAALEVAWVLMHDIPEYVVTKQQVKVALNRETEVRRESWAYNVMLRTLRSMCVENEIFRED